MGRQLELRTFNAGDGDCLLISAFEDEGRLGGFYMLIDGGRKGTFTKFAAPYLYGNDQITQLDLVVVSHIDNDHISGILRLTKDSSLRAIFEDTFTNCGEESRPPDDPCSEKRCRCQLPEEVRIPPEAPDIELLWHNRVSDMPVNESSSKLGHSLAVAASMVSGTLNLGDRTPAAMRYAASIDNLATGHASAVEIEHRIEERGIPKNDEILTVGEVAGKNLPNCPLAITVIGPSKERLERVRKDWEKWKKENGKRIREIHDAVNDETHVLGAVRPDGLALGGGNISAPNLASLMLLVSWPGDARGHDLSSTILLTGDGSSEDILDGLVETGHLTAGDCPFRHDECSVEDTMHIAVLKVPHHGANDNVTQALCDHVIADDYVFCGNGNHTNPELDVLKRIFTTQRPAGTEHFTFWFSSSQHCPDLNTDRKKHMAAVEELMLKFRGGDPNFNFVMLDPRAASNPPHLRNDAPRGKGHHLLWPPSG